MRRIVTREEMREAEQCTMQKHFISSLILMERAALSVCEELSKRKLSMENVLIVCGTGNKGGDGMAIARILLERGICPVVVLIGSRGKCSIEAASQMKSLISYGVKIQDEIISDTYTVVIDALFGIGLNRELDGSCKQVVDQMNALSGFKIAVDIPSGINANTGAMMGTAFHADLTVTFAYGKIGMYSYPGTDYCGEITVKEIGICVEPAGKPVTMVYEAGDRVLPARKQPSNKSTYGKVLLIAGSRQMCGAAILSAEAALRAGAGMVKLVTPECNRDAVLGRLPETMLLTYEDAETLPENFYAELAQAATWADVIGIGPGLSKTSIARELLNYVQKNANKPFIMDADALNILAEVNPSAVWDDREVIFTPHIKEMERLCKVPVCQIKKDLITYARNYAKEHDVVCVLKDAHSVTVAPDGSCYLNLSGNPGMATAGAGDVLTGIICALKAQNMNAFEAAAKGVFLHAAAGDCAAAKQGEYNIIASDLIRGLAAAEPEMTIL